MAAESGLNQRSSAAWLAGGGEMGERMRALDWTKTPLGPTENWPQSLRSAVSILLPSKAQIVLFWGAEYAALYNDAYRPVFGGKHPWALGAPASEAWREIWSDVLKPLLDGVVTTGEAFWGKDLLFFLERHGYAEETYFDVSYDPVRDETDKVGGVFCIVSETTRRVLGERRLAALRDLGRIATHAASVSSVLNDAIDVLKRYDRDIPFAAIYRSTDGSSPVLESSFGMIDGERSFGFEIPFAELSATDDAVLTTFEPGARTPSGPWTEAPRQALTFKIATGGNAPFGYLVAGISSRRELDAEYRDFLRLVAANLVSAIASVQAFEEERRRATALAEIDRAKTAFFSNVSHEFRTPLALMLGPLEELIAASQGAERSQLQVVERNGRRLLRLVNSLLDFARIEAGRVQCRFQATDLAALTLDLASTFRSACERAGLALEVHCEACSESAYVDRDMWEKIVLNLMSNAFKFTLEGRIAVRLRELADGFELAIRDTGAGIPADALNRIFERFYRVESARGRSFEGSGIGLALVSELAKLHGGKIEVQSDVDHGSTFTVFIPKGYAHLPTDHVLHALAPDSVPREPRTDLYAIEALSWLHGETASSEADAPRARRAGAQRVLLADDNADLREYARRLLSEHYAVEIVANGEMALSAARRQRPDLIVSDVMMPRMDGFELLREIRADQELRTVPLILLSARAGEEARIEGLNAGADDYIVKPFSSRELLVRIGTLLKSSHLNRLAREALAQFETLLNNAPLGVYLIDDELRIAAVNPIAKPVFGAIPNLIGRDFSAVIHTLWPNDYADEIVRIFKNTLDTGEPYLVPERIETRRDRGVVEYYEWQVNRIPLSNGRFGVVCYFRDISKSVLAREALHEADARKDEFLATLAHELRNPLAPLRTSLELLKLEAGPARAGSTLEIMDRQVAHLVRLVDDLLEVSRITRGNVELRKTPLALDVALDNALETSSSLIRAGGHRLDLKIPSEPIVVDADPVRLAQIFANLLNNAAKYSERGGIISVEARREGAEAVVTIRDTGDGIGAEQLPQLFKFFSRGRESDKRHQSGLGIGLALVRRLVEMHGGRIDVSSDGLGCGSSFTVRLPLCETYPASPIDAPNRALRCARLKILIVDDNRDAAESLGMLLTQLGADVSTAQSGSEALSLAESDPPRLVLLDIGMPGMDGYEVARRLRAMPNSDDMLIAALTGWAQDADRERARAAGFDVHFVKPVDFAALEALLAKLCGNDLAESPPASPRPIVTELPTI